jgi:hypothetical protein
MTKNSDAVSTASEPGKSGATSLVRNALKSLRQGLPTQPQAAVEYVATPVAAPAANPKSLIKAAWNGFVSDGELLAGYHAAVADAENQRTAMTIRKGNLDERIAAIDAELSAIVYQEPAAPPVPRVLGTMSKILPFNRGE